MIQIHSTLEVSSIRVPGVVSPSSTNFGWALARFMSNFFSFERIALAPGVLVLSIVARL